MYIVISTFILNVVVVYYLMNLLWLSNTQLDYWKESNLQMFKQYSKIETFIFKQLEILCV